MTEHIKYLWRITLALCSTAVIGCTSTPPPPPPPAAIEQSASTAAPREGHAAGLRYLEVITGATPAEAQAEALPLVVFIHGRGDRAHTAWIDGFQARARFVFPEAPAHYGGGFSWFPFSVAQSDSAELAQGVGTVASQLAQALGELSRTRPTRGKPIVAGFSQGAILTFALALLHPESIAFGVPIAGMLPEPLLRDLPRAGVRYPPLRVLHGKSDTMITFEPTERMTNQLRERGLDVQLRAFEGAGHELNDAMRSTLYAWLHEALDSNARAKP